jgi:transposase-like protein
MKSLSCPNRHCPPSRNGGTGAIIRHGFYTTQWGKHRRYQCQACGKTFSTATGTPYYRLHHRRTTFDEVATLSVEGLKSAIARVKRVTWNTVHRWLERAATWCRRFSDRKIRRLTTVELQSDEIKTIIGCKAIKASTAGFRRFRETEHLVCRTAESHDPTGLSLSGSANDMSGPLEGTSRRSHRVIPLLLQFHQASQCAQIRT